MQLRELLDNPGFRTGLGVGVAVLAVMLVLIGARALGWPETASGPGPRRPAWPERTPPLAGLAAVAASGIAVVADGNDALGSTRLAFGLVLLIAGPYAVAITLGDSGARSLYATLAAVPGAAVVAWAATAGNHLGWVPWLVFGSTVVGGAAVADFDGANVRAGLGPVLLAIAALGMYSTLPDTEQVAVVVGAMLPVALLGWPFALASLGPGAYGIVGVFAWVAAVDGRGRPGSVVAAIACLGLMLVEPVVRRILGRHIRTLRSPRSAAVTCIIALQVPLVLVLARVAGLHTSARRAAEISAVALAAGGVALAVVLARRGDPAQHPADHDRHERSAS